MVKKTRLRRSVKPSPSSSSLWGAQAIEVECVTVVEALAHVAWIAKTDGTPRYFNRPWFDYTNLSLTQCLNFGWHALVHPDDLEGCSRGWARGIRTGRSFEIEFRLKRAADRVYRWQAVQATPIRTPEGQVSRWLGIGTDIHERKLAVEESWCARDLFQFMTEEVKDWAIFALDVEGKVVSWNTGAERLMGYRADEVLGKHLSVLFDFDNPEQRKSGKTLLETRLQGRLELEGRAMRKDGSLFWACLITRPFRGETGAVQGCALVIHDLTQHKGAEAGVRLYMSLWENLPNGLLILRPEKAGGEQKLRILAANPAVLQVIRQPGLTVDDLIDKTPAEVLPALFKNHISTSASETIRLGMVREVGELQYRNEQSPGNTFSIKAFPLPAHCVGIIFENITERKQTEEALRISETNLRGLLEAGYDAMVITDQEGRIVLTNRATELLFGYLRRELEQQPLEILLPEGFREQHLAARKAYLAKSRVRPLGAKLELFGCRKDGSEFPVGISLAFWQAAEGVRTYTSIRDLTGTIGVGPSSGRAAKPTH